jgi:hypothetical protein
MPAPGRPLRPTAESYGAKPPDLRQQAAGAPLRARISAQIHHRQTANSQVGDPHTLHTAKDVTSQVKQRTTGTSLFNHPQVGPLELNYERLLIPGSGMQALVTYHAQPGSDSEERLRLLDSITTAGPNTPYGHDQPARTRQPRATSQRDGRGHDLHRRRARRPDGRRHGRLNRGVGTLKRAFRHWPQKWMSAAMTDEKEGPGRPKRCPLYG